MSDSLPTIDAILRDAQSRASRLGAAMITCVDVAEAILSDPVVQDARLSH